LIILKKDMNNLLEPITLRQFAKSSYCGFGRCWKGCSLSHSKPKYRGKSRIEASYASYSPANSYTDPIKVIISFQI